MATTYDDVRSPSAPRPNRYYLGMAVACVVLVLAGFSERYYARLTGLHAATPLVHVHAATFAAWFVLLLVQTSLVAANRPHLHRRLGLAAAALVPLVVIVGLATSIEAARAGWNPAGAPNGVLGFLALGIVDTSLFGAFAGAALWLRRRPELHKRLMLLATVSLLWAAISRVPFAAGIATAGSQPPAAVIVGCFTLLAALALSGPCYDFFSGRRVYRSEIAAGLLIIAGRPLARAMVESDAWRTFGGWLLR